MAWLRLGMLSRLARSAPRPLLIRPRRAPRRPVTSEASSPPSDYVPRKTLARHFVCCAVPMVGFGLMDNTILIRAGDAIDRYFGVAMNLRGMESAACGQVLSDFCGVCFGGVVESVSRRVILPAAFTASQLALRTTQLTGVAGAALGVVFGCILGMANFMFMDLEEAERLKTMAELGTIFETVMSSAKECLGAQTGSIFLVDEAKQELFTRVALNVDHIIRVPLTEHSIAGWVALKNKVVNLEDAYTDERFNRETDKRTGNRTRTMLSHPVVSIDNPDKVIAVVQLINKPTPFDDNDIKVVKMLSTHTAIFLAKVA